MTQRSRFPPSRSPLLFLVEGIHDVAFLKCISRILAAAEETCPDLARLERRGELIFVPFGGGDVLLTARRFAPLELWEFHLYDREIAPETKRRQAACRLVNADSRCRAVLTTKRSLENYLHPDCIREVCDVELPLDDGLHVPDAVARRLWERQRKPIAWHDVPIRARRRLRDKAKRRLNRDAVERMTPERLAASDSAGEIRGWLNTVANLLWESR